MSKFYVVEVDEELSEKFRDTIKDIIGVKDIILLTANYWVIHHAIVDATGGRGPW